MVDVFIVRPWRLIDYAFCVVATSTQCISHSDQIGVVSSCERAHLTGDVGGSLGNSLDSEIPNLVTGEIHQLTIGR